MATIDQELLERLAKKLNVTKARVYAIIQERANQKHLPRHLAALVVAGENGISISKYADDKDLAELRGIPSQPAAAAASIAIAATSTPKRKTKGKIPKTKENTVFVVHGRDSSVTDAMYQFLGALGLKPQEWGHALRSVRGKGGNPYVNDAVNKIMEQAEAIVVLLTPDDEAWLKPQFVDAKREKQSEGKARGQARPNVIFETGIAIGAYHKKTVIVQVGDVKPFTDIGGMHILQMTGSDTSRNELSKRLQTCGCTINTDGDHWLRAGDFAPTEPKKKRKKN